MKEKELAIGYLLTEDVLKSVDEIQGVQLGKNGGYQVKLRPGVDAEKRVLVSQPFTRFVLSACGSSDYWALSKLIDRLDLRALVAVRFTVKAEVILEVMRRLNMLAETYRKVHGVHIAALVGSCDFSSSLTYMKFKNGLMIIPLFRG